MTIAVEGLESRVFLSVAFRGGILSITGTDGDDVIRLSHPVKAPHGRRVLLGADDSITLVDINQTRFRFHTRAIHEITIDAMGGDDRINLWRSPNFNCLFPEPIVFPILDFSPLIHTMISGGEGRDSIVGGLGDDVILGGPGSDTLFGNDGDDRLIGGEGDDYLFGAYGEDVLRGSAGDDILDGGVGNDRSFGGSGNDFLDGVDGDDELWGGGGDDELKADSAADLIAGGTGEDTLRYPDNGESTPPFEVPADIERLRPISDFTVCV